MCFTEQSVGAWALVYSITGVYRRQCEQQRSTVDGTVGQLLPKVVFLYMHAWIGSFLIACQHIIGCSVPNICTYAVMTTIISTSITHLTQPQPRIVRHEVYDHLSLLLDGQRQWQVTERVELHRDFRTIRTDERRLEQTVENVNNDGVIASLIVAPRFHRHLLIRHISSEIF